MQKKGGVFTYENGLLVLLGLSFGVAFFDRNAATILVPYIDDDLQLTNTQVGFLGSGLAITWALGAYLIARWSDKRGVRNLAAAVGLGLPALFPSLVRQNSALAIAGVVLALGLIYYLGVIGWDVFDDVCAEYL